jgi:aspartyl aminopeptidase
VWFAQYYRDGTGPLQNLEMLHGRFQDPTIVATRRPSVHGSPRYAPAMVRTDEDSEPLGRLLAFLDASPSPYHAVAMAAAALEAAGFRARDETQAWGAAGGNTGRHYIVRGGSLVAWVLDEPGQIEHGFRIVGAHTDSPNLRVKPRPDGGHAGYRQLGVEVYGGALWNSWLDRDLGLSGRVAIRGGGADTDRAVELRLVRVDRPLLRVPQLAIHLDRGVNENGLKLNPQHHLVPLWALDDVGTDEVTFTRFLGERLGLDPARVLAWDVMLHDTTPAAVLGRDGEFLSSARIDNLVSCWAAAEAIAATPTDAGGRSGRGVAVICLFDHEEIGSQSSSGAAGSILPTILERVATDAGCSRNGFFETLARSACVSADGAHATHPNYAERHEPGHHIAPNAGPVIKVNANVRYATDAGESAAFQLDCERAGVAVQEFVVRTDLACGSTIGPVTAAQLGIGTIDVGVAQLSMHSARELCGAHDPDRLRRVLAEFLARP